MPTDISLSEHRVCAVADTEARPETRREGDGFTVRDLARRWRISVNKVLAFIKRGELYAINTADQLCNRPRFVVLPEDGLTFERRRQAATPAAPKPKRRKRRDEEEDFFPHYAD